MNLRLLEYLVAVADTRHFGEAAERCGVTQPTLSAQIARLEAELDAQLVERGRHGARLTPLGERVTEQAIALLDQAGKLRQTCRQHAQPLAGPLRLGVIPTAGPYLLPRLIPVFRRHYPDTRVIIEETTTDDLLRGLRRGELDVGILAFPFDQSALSVEPLLDEPFFAVLPLDHKLAKRKALRREDLSREPLLLLRQGHCLREQTASFCQLNPDQAAVQGTSVEALKQMVAMGLGVTVLPEMSVTGRFAGAAPVAVVPFRKPVPSRTLVLAWRDSSPYFGAMRGLAKRLRTAARSG